MAFAGSVTSACRSPLAANREPDLTFVLNTIESIVPHLREHRFELRSVPLTPASVASYDALLLATNHDDFDYAMLAQRARLIVDTRGVYLDAAPNVVKA